MRTILIAHHDPATLELLHELMGEVGTRDVHIHSHAALTPALRRQLQHPDCVLAVLDAQAAVVNGARDLRHRSVCELLGPLRGGAAGPAVVVLASGNDPSLSDMVVGWPRARLIVPRPADAWEDTLAGAAREALGMMNSGALPDRRRTRTVFRIKVANHAQGSWSMERRGPNQLVPDLLPLKFSTTGIRDLDSHGRDLGCSMAQGDWNTQWNFYANTMYERLFKCDPRLHDAFEQAVSEQGPRAVRLVFELDHACDGIAVEALKRDGSGRGVREWYALRSPIFREYLADERCRPSLFADARSRGERIDCLLVAGDSQGGAGMHDLKQIEAEVRAVHALLERRGLEGANIGKVESLMLVDERPASMEPKLLEKLSSRRWQLVHYAGHSRLRDNKPELLLSARHNVALDVAHVLDRLPEVQFLFLSSCQSADANFLRAMSHAQVPSVLGYRWRIADEPARTLAERFYRMLFQPGGYAYNSLARALASARKRVFGGYADASWASAALLMKGREASVRSVDGGTATGTEALAGPAGPTAVNAVA